MLDKDYRYYISKINNIKTYRRKRNHTPWLVLLGCIGILGTGASLALYDRDLSKNLDYNIQTQPETLLNPSTNTGESTSPFPKDRENAITVPPVQRVANSEIWQEVIVGKGDSLSVIFSNLGLDPRESYEIIALGKIASPLAYLMPGNLLKIAYTESEGIRKLSKLHTSINTTDYLEIYLKDNKLQAHKITQEPEIHHKLVIGTIKHSLVKDGLHAGLKNTQIMNLAHIFRENIDFTSDLQPKDTFKVLLEESYLQNKVIGKETIIAAEFINRGKISRAIRYTDLYGNSSYYTPEGESLRRDFSRAPVHYTRISSYFNAKRKHPVLQKVRAHNGVDYAAPSGTPIQAASDGKVIFFGKKGGYGNAIILKHNEKYRTLYAHLSRFKKGLKRGKKVKKGETIGYVGQTGLATGPHLHYEIQVNGIPRNPLTVELPKAENIPAAFMEDFQNTAHELITQLEMADTDLAILD
ncbi:M23 family metallopeptidase [Candidatus Nitrosacidococcus tergens]|uniref:Peptidase M23 n=1 Tax=Candidatus Nitrosacidococcus tergens TaxID=553981 RepID=A0A7G1QA60_9GAMM|nr:peptidoglycan DD-metalloendopeptidase family protein [Candidatus Nitrosacidococcus tergens]CAB1276320.1 Peptidase M23 [Candidatus Nitrosacidococcus tergens]